MRPDVHALAGAYALDALPADEQQRFERHLASCEACAEEVRGLAETAALLGEAAARTVAAQVGRVVAVPDQRAGAAVDLVLGAAFVRLLAPAEAAAALSPSPEPVPSGC